MMEVSVEGEMLPQKYIKKQISKWKENKGELENYKVDTYINILENTVALFEEGGIKSIAISIAHEIKNSLALISANIDLLELKDISAKESRRNYDVIRGEIDRVNDMVIEFINLNKMSKCQFELVDVNYILEELIEEYTISLGHKVEFNYHNYDQILVNGSKKDLRMLFSNIIKNSIEAMNYEGSVAIDICSENNNAEITIVDSGSCFSYDGIFEPFYSNKDGGNGVGLSLCKQVAALHNGSFELYENGRGGAVAKVIIPC